MRWWRGIPLRAKLPIIIAVLLGLAMSVTSITAWLLLRVSMVDQLDDDLLAAAQPLANQQLIRHTPEPDSDLAQLLPSDYFLIQQNLDGTEAFRYYHPDAPTGSEPRVPTFSLDHTPGADGIRTVYSTDGNTTWRMVMGFNLVNNSIVGITWVGLPMDQIQKTLADLGRILALVSTAVVILGATLGYLAVSQSLRGLRSMEVASREVAAGNLAARTPPAPLTTEVGKLSAAFNSMIAALQQSFARQEANETRMRQFISDASHELRTPLASMRGYGELYRMGAVPDHEVPATFSRIEQEAIRMGEMVNGLLTLARMDEGITLNLTEVDLTEIADDAAATLRSLDPSRVVQVGASGPCIAETDRNQVRQLFTNLVGNIAQHTPAGSPVEIEVLPDGNYAVIKIIDHGPGIPLADAAHIFERFYRADSSRTRASGGTGLGLAIASSIVAAHRGTIHHEPTPGGGATMVVILPRSLAPHQPTPVEPS